MTIGRMTALLTVLAIVFSGVVLGQNVQVRDFFTCEDVIRGEVQNITTDFGDDTEKVAIFMRLENISESLAINWEWTQLSGNGQLSQTQMIPSPREQGYDFWEEYSCWGILDLSQMPPDIKNGRWRIKAMANGRLLGQSEFTLTKKSSGKKEPEQISLLNEGSIENVVFNYPTDWYLYDDELDDGFCQVWLMDEAGSFISFSIYLTTELLLDDPQLEQNMIKREKTTLSGLNVDHALVNLYDDTDDEWYKSSIYQISDIWSLSGKYIFLVSYAPVEKYDDYAEIFIRIFESVGTVSYTHLRAHET